MKLGKIELEHLLAGAAFLGSGGGGSIKAGQMFIDRIVKEGGVYITTKPPTGDGCVMADIGANAAIEAGQVDALIRCFTVMDDYWHAVNSTHLTCLYPIETGPENTLAPMVLGAIKGLPVFDGDGGGRTVPEVQLCSYASAGINVAPLAMANEGKDAIIAFSANAADMDKMLRPMTAAPQFGN